MWVDFEVLNILWDTLHRSICEYCLVMMQTHHLLIGWPCIYTGKDTMFCDLSMDIDIDTQFSIYLIKYVLLPVHLFCLKSAISKLFWNMMCKSVCVYLHIVHTSDTLREHPFNYGFFRSQIFFSLRSAAEICFRDIIIFLQKK